MAKKFAVECASEATEDLRLKLLNYVGSTEKKVLVYADKIEQVLLSVGRIDDSLSSEIHEFGCDSLEKLSTYLIRIYPLAGLHAADSDTVLNQIFRDFFTATQHRNFRRITNDLT
jgi:hypothetical protein